MESFGPSFIRTLTLVAKSILQVYQRMQQCTLEINYKVFHIEDGSLQQKDQFNSALFLVVSDPLNIDL